MSMKAVQQIMLGTVCKNEAQALETLNAIKAAGYDGIELNGFMIRPTSFLVRALTKAAGMPTGKGGNFNWVELTKAAGLQVVSLHEDLGSIKRDPDAVMEEAKKFGTDKIVITGMYRFDYTDLSALEGLTKDLNQYGQVLADAGISLLYHNHNCEFRKLENGQTAYDYLIANTSPDYVNFELDTYWPTEAGVPALELMQELGDRIKLWHINDRGTKAKGPSITPILTSDSMELGTGNMNLDALMQQAMAVNVSAVILESHKNWIDGSPVRSLQKSAEFLNRYL